MGRLPSDQFVRLSSKELTVLSDILRRVEVGDPFAKAFTRDWEFVSAFDKLEDAKFESYRIRFSSEAS